MKLVILYEEIAGYFIACLNHFTANYDVEIHLVKRQSNSVAPFEIETHQKIQVYERHNYDQDQLLELVKKINPDGIFSGGWSYKPYLTICKKYNTSIPVFVGFDNQWSGSFKQQLVSIFGRRFIKSHFNSCFVPGERQVTFAKKLGFSNQQINTNAYCCDVDLFEQKYNTYKLNQSEKLPKRLLFVGRYTNVKGITDLWDTFAEISDGHDWELWCLGNGDIAPISHPKIKHFGFIQPKDLDNFIANTSVLILPSHFEPWGVVVHEYAIAGFPIISSSEVGAADVFVEEGINGFKFSPGNKDALKQSLLNVFNASESELKRLSENSHRIGYKITNKIWSETMFKMLSKKSTQSPD